MMPAATMNEAEQARRRRVRNSAIFWALIAAGFYLGFVVLALVRGSR